MCINHNCNCCKCSTSMELAAPSGQQDVVLLSPLILRITWGVDGFTDVLQHKPRSQIASQAYANYAIGPSHVSFLFQEWASHQFLYVHVVMTFAFASKFWCDHHAHWLGLNHWGLNHCNPLQYIHSRNMCLLVLVHDPCQGCMEQLLPSLLWLECLLVTQGAILQPFNQYETELWGHGSVSPNPPVFPTWQRGVFFSRLGST